jgi:addiction module HigA family antidote
MSGWDCDDVAQHRQPNEGRGKRRVHRVLLPTDLHRATLSDLLHAKAALTPEMALRIEKAFGPDMNHLLRMQLAYDVAKTWEQDGISQPGGGMSRLGSR